MIVQRLSEFTKQQRPVLPGRGSTSSIDRRRLTLIDTSQCIDLKQPHPLKFASRHAWNSLLMLSTISCLGMPIRSSSPADETTLRPLSTYLVMLCFNRQRIPCQSGKPNAISTGLADRNLLFACNHMGCRCDLVSATSFDDQQVFREALAQRIAPDSDHCFCRLDVSL